MHKLFLFHSYMFVFTATKCKILKYTFNKTDAKPEDLAGVIAMHVYV